MMLKGGDSKGQVGGKIGGEKLGAPSKQEPPKKTGKPARRDSYLRGQAPKKSIWKE